LQLGADEDELLADDVIPGWLERVNGRLDRLEKMAQE
jgi:hypothetical protein